MRQKQKKMLTWKPEDLTKQEHLNSDKENKEIQKTEEKRSI